MNLLEQLQTKLDGLGSGPGVVDVRDNGKRLTCELIGAEPLACRFTRLALQAKSLAGATLEDLKRVSDELASRVTYLLEPLGPVELDHDQCVVQMRSTPPQQDDDGTSYYELLVRRASEGETDQAETGEIVLCRYQKASGDVRQAIPATVTREVLLRLAGDFAAVVD